MWHNAQRDLSGAVGDVSFEEILGLTLFTLYAQNNN